MEQLTMSQNKLLKTLFKASIPSELKGQRNGASGFATVSAVYKV
jgi:hypothetical protein